MALSTETIHPIDLISRASDKVPRDAIPDFLTLVWELSYIAEFDERAPLREQTPSEKTLPAVYDNAALDLQRTITTLAEIGDETAIALKIKRTRDILRSIPCFDRSNPGSFLIAKQGALALLDTFTEQLAAENPSFAAAAKHTRLMGARRAA